MYPVQSVNHHSGRTGRDHFGVFRQFHEIGVRFDESAHRVVDDVSGSLMKHCMVQSS